MLQHLIEVWFHWVHDWGYVGIIILMAMESSIFPVPSEIVIPPAAILAGYGGQDGHMTLTGVVLAGTFGSWLGSAITYWVAMFVGRPFLAKYGAFILLPPEKVARAERFMHRYESGGIFFARLLPVIRHLISIPAGIIRMNFARFSALTIIGSAIWCSVLAWLGGRVGARLDAKQLGALQSGIGVDLGVLIHAVKDESLLVLSVFLLVGASYFLVMHILDVRSRNQRIKDVTVLSYSVLMGALVCLNAVQVIHALQGFGDLIALGRIYKAGLLGGAIGMIVGVVINSLRSKIRKSPP